MRLRKWKTVNFKQFNEGIIDSFRKDLVSHDLLSLCKKYASLNLAMSTKQKQNKYAGDIMT